MKKFIAKIFVCVFCLSVLISACDSGITAVRQKVKNPNLHTVVVKEVVQTSSYTYMLLQEEDAEYWGAVAKTEVEEGKTYYYDSFMEMKDFPSKELNKTFETIYFINEISDQPIPSAQEQAEKQHTGKVTSDKNTGISVNPVEGGISISELFKNRNDFSEKVVKVTGQVTKVNTGIMGKNWIHIQDGSSDGNNYDLTITTNDIASLGDVVVFEGKISLNKDFGYGYAYEVLMEDAKKVNLTVQ